MIGVISHIYGNLRNMNTNSYLRIHFSTYLYDLIIFIRKYAHIWFLPYQFPHFSNPKQFRLSSQLFLCLSKHRSEEVKILKSVVSHNPNDVEKIEKFLFKTQRKILPYRLPYRAPASKSKAHNVCL